ncbi:MAG: histidine phosphatase family protein [Bacteroidia bacterium]
MDFIGKDKHANIRKTIHLIRHGQTDFNKKNIIQGSGIDSNLNAFGKEQARKYFEYYKIKIISRFTHQKLKRTIESVELFISNGLPHSSHEEFNEINWGIMEGQESNPENKVIYENIVNSWTNGELHIAIQNGETPLEMFERQKKGLQILMEKQDEEKILLCMHGRAMRSFLCLLTNTPLNEMEKWQHSNLCLYELNYNGICFDITKSNDTSHLKELIQS